MVDCRSLKREAVWETGEGIAWIEEMGLGIQRVREAGVVIGLLLTSRRSHDGLQLEDLFRGDS